MECIHGYESFVDEKIKQIIKETKLRRNVYQKHSRPKKIKKDPLPKSFQDFPTRGAEYGLDLKEVT